MFSALIGIFVRKYSQKAKKINELEERIAQLEEVVRLCYPNKKTDDARRTKRVDRVRGTIH